MAQHGAAWRNTRQVLYTKGRDLEDEDVFDLVSDNKNMSKAMSEYGNARSTSITTAKRLGQFLGQEMVKTSLAIAKLAAKNPFLTWAAQSGPWS